MRPQYISDFFWCQHCHTVILWKFCNISFKGKIINKSIFLQFQSTFSNWNWKNWQKLKSNRNRKQIVSSLNKTYFNHVKTRKCDTDCFKNIWEVHSVVITFWQSFVKKNFLKQVLRIQHDTYIIHLSLKIVISFLYMSSYFLLHSL